MITGDEIFRISAPPMSIGEGASMDSTSAPSASIWLENIMTSLKETAKNSYSQIISFLSTVIMKIKDAGKVFAAIIGSIEDDTQKEAMNICYSLFTWLLSILFTLKITDTGKASSSANDSVMKAMVLIKSVSSLTTLSATLSQMHKRNPAPLLLMLLLESIASILALSVISRLVLWICVFLWLCIFVLFGYCCHTELKELILQIKTWTGFATPEDGSLPTVA
ncbi:uncharacterized protein LOC129295077 [Prosopis cineraria]|uniref:uncharacterized protein LOC129295077 n=1 Tax=Prosopis cineraria TaxID=364024 RepID=UPI00240F0B14|nr:uncharacterized protein LOC129295077 [Prosopis cineraria]